MKKGPLAVLAFLALVSLAAAELSQDGAKDICGPYGNEGESIQVYGPITCDGSYLICEFVYYGNKQGVVLAISKSNETVLPADSNILQGIISARYASGDGGSSLFSTLISDRGFAVSLRGMNVTLDDYGRILKSLKENELLGESSLADFEGRITGVKGDAAQLAKDIDYLYNASQAFLESPDCWELADYLQEMNQTTALVENFSTSWNDFITRYNTLAGRMEAGYMASINPSDAQILAQRVASVKVVIGKYQEDEAEFQSTAIENLKTRIDRKSAMDKLKSTQEIVKGSTTDAIEKYNKAVEAFNNREYSKSRGLANEAIALAALEPPDQDGEPLVEVPQDYSGYFIAVGVLLVIILFIALSKRRGDGGERPEKKEREPKPAKGKAGSWSWVKREASSMERKAS